MMNFIRNAAERVQRGDLTEIYEEIRWMYQYIKKYRLWIFFYVAVGSLGVVMSLGSSVVSKYLIDVVMARRISELAGQAALMTAMVAGNIAISAAVSRLSAKITVSVQNEMRGELYIKILYSRWQQLQLKRTGDLPHRLNRD